MTQAADSSLVVVSAGPEVAADLAELHRQIFDPAWDEASMTAMLQHAGSIACLAMAGEADTKVGFAMGRVVADEAEILTIGTLAEWRRRGVAARLVDELSRLAAQGGAERMFLEVAADNDAAQALYLKHGYTRAGMRRGYYERPGGSPIDAAILVKRLGP